MAGHSDVSAPPRAVGRPCVAGGLGYAGVATVVDPVQDGLGRGSSTGRVQMLAVLQGIGGDLVDRDDQVIGVTVAQPLGSTPRTHALPQFREIAGGVKLDVDI